MCSKMIKSIIENLYTKTQQKLKIYKYYYIHTCKHYIPNRFNDLEEPIATRRTQLEDSLKLFQFLHAVELEMAWIKEHKLQAASVDYGNSFEAVQNLQKKHNVGSMNKL